MFQQPFGLRIIYCCQAQHTHTHTHSGHGEGGRGWAPDVHSTVCDISRSSSNLKLQIQLLRGASTRAVNEFWHPHSKRSQTWNPQPQTQLQTQPQLGTQPDSTRPGNARPGSAMHIDRQQLRVSQT